MQSPIPGTLPNAQTQSVNVTPMNVDQRVTANTGTAQRPPQRPAEFGQATTSSRDSGGGGDVYASSSTVATVLTPICHPSAPQPRKTWSSPNPSASAANHQQPVMTCKEWTAQKRSSGDPLGVCSSYNRTRGYDPIASSRSSHLPTVEPSGGSSTLLQRSSYPAPTATQYLSLSSTTSRSSQAASKPEENISQTVPLVSHGSGTEEEGIAMGGISASGAAGVGPLGSNATGSEAVQKSKGKTSEQEEEERPPTLESLLANHASLNVTNELEAHPPFDSGALADVRSGYLRKRKVFVKVLKNYESWRVDTHKPHITTEIPKWAALKHQNVCEFFGYSTRFGPYPVLVSAWCGGGTVFEYLRGHHLLLEKRIRLAQDVAEGLQYLHENDVIHGDLTLKNILIDDSGVAQLCDFGLTQLAEWKQHIEPTVASNYSGRDRYTAPELSCAPVAVATFESDVYSLGCILLKFIEELNPFDGIQNVAKQKRKQPPAPPARRKDTTGVLLDMTPFFWNQLEACWEEPSMRPTIYKIVSNLQTLANRVTSTQPEQIENPPPYPAPAPAPVDKATLNYGVSVSIPTQPPVEANVSFANAFGSLAGLFTSIRIPALTRPTPTNCNLESPCSIPTQPPVVTRSDWLKETRAIPITVDTITLTRTFEVEALIQLLMMSTVIRLAVMKMSPLPRAIPVRFSSRAYVATFAPVAAPGPTHAAPAPASKVGPSDRQKHPGPGTSNLARLLKLLGSQAS